MPEIFVYRASDKKMALRQGEILSGVIQIKPIPDQSSSSLESISYEPIVHPYVIIVTQDCELDGDYQARQNKNGDNQGGNLLLNKPLNSIILCEVYTATNIRTNKNHQINSERWNLVKTNRYEQYHFFQKVPPQCDLLQEGLPELTADFKRVFGIDADFLYYQLHSMQAQRRTIISSPYLEHFSHRYYSFHSRVALPSPHESEKGG